MVLHRSPAAATSSTRWAKARAVLIGALVIGVGSATTLAAWTDSEHAAGSFGASVFAIQGSANGSPFAEHPTAGTAAAMAFSATSMSPGSRATAAFDVRTTSNSTVGGTVKLTGSTPSGDQLLAGKLAYRAAVVPAGTNCATYAYTGTPVPASSVFATPETTVSAASANTVRYCFEVTLAQDTTTVAQGKSGSIFWAFTATSAK